MNETWLVDLGRIPYGEAWELQHRLVEERVAGRVPDVLLLLEHDHVLTKGRGTHAENLLLGDASRLPVFDVERGGDVTYHGPGQLVGYPIVALGNPPDVRGHLRRLEEVLVRALGDLGVLAGRREKHTGVWVDTASGPRKLASIGIAVRGGVAYHGFALNVNADLSWFSLIRPCGLPAESMTSLEVVLGDRVPMEQVRNAVARRFGDVFGATLREPRGGEIAAFLPAPLSPA